MNELMEKMKGSWVQVYSGGKFFPFDPQAKDVYIEDIAKALSYMCRFNGHTRHFYSVGQHSILCATELLKAGHSMRVALIGLMHDGSEAYFGDIPTPIKQFLPELKTIEAKIQDAVYDGLNIPRPTVAEYATVRRMDVSMLVLEAQSLTDDVERWTAEYEYENNFVLSPSLICQSDPLHIETAFLALFEQLCLGVKKEEVSGSKVRKIAIAGGM